MKLLILVALLLTACDIVDATPVPMDTPTLIPSTTATSTPTATATLTTTPTVAPVRRMSWDMNIFPVGSAEWQAWNEYDAELRRLDADAKIRGEVGLTANEQAKIWADALKKYGVIP